MLDQLKTDMKAAMRAKEKTRLSTIRMLISEFKNAAIDKGGELTEADAITLLSREAKKRRESFDSYAAAGRDDLAEQEKAELEVIEGYLPKQLSEDEVRAIAQEVLGTVKPSSAKEMGAVMGQIMPKIKGQFDGKRASAVIREEFNAFIA